MPLTPEQISELKKQLHAQIAHLPPEQKKAAQQQIEEMSDEAIESMLEKQKSQAPQKPIFRAIIEGEMPSKRIDENKDAIAVLDIRPISKGHTIIIPKVEAKNSKTIPTSAFALAKKISKKMESKLKAKSIEIQTESKFGEVIINIVPIYDKPLNLSSPRLEMPEEELFEIQKKLAKVQKPKVIKLDKKPSKSSNIIKLKRRIP